MQQMTDGSPAQLCTESVPTTYSGYKAILVKVVWLHLSVVTYRIQRTPLYHYLHPSDTRKTNNILLTHNSVLSSTPRRAGTRHTTTDLEHFIWFVYVYVYLEGG